MLNSINIIPFIILQMVLSRYLNTIGDNISGTAKNMLEIMQIFNAKKKLNLIFFSPYVTPNDNASIFKHKISSKNAAILHFMKIW